MKIRATCNRTQHVNLLIVLATSMLLYFVLELKRKIDQLYILWDRLCGLVVRVSGYGYRGPGFDPRRYQIF
jgi:hypothetical protein